MSAHIWLLWNTISWDTSRYGTISSDLCLWVYARQTDVGHKSCAVWNVYIRFLTTSCTKRCTSNSCPPTMSLCQYSCMFYSLPMLSIYVYIYIYICTHTHTHTQHKTHLPCIPQFVSYVQDISVMPPCIISITVSWTKASYTKACRTTTTTTTTTEATTTTTATTTTATTKTATAAATTTAATTTATTKTTTTTATTAAAATTTITIITTYGV